MRRRPATVRHSFLLFALACLCAANAHARQSNAAQEWPATGSPAESAGKTRKIDEYGKVGHCDETARLDNFAIELQNEPGTTGYLLVYVGRNDLPSWTQGILKRAAAYLVEARGLESDRIKVVNGGYREERTTELWVVPKNDPPPQPSNTVEVKLDRTRAYKWDEDGFNVELNLDDSEVVGSEPAEGAPEKDEAERAREAEWERDVAKYRISTSFRGVLEDEDDGEVEPEISIVSEAEAGDEVAGDPAAAVETNVEVGEVTISLWWKVEALADELKAVPDARLCVVYYWGLKNATQERVQGMVEQAVSKTVAQLGVSRDRIILVDGGRSASPGLELWVVPRGAATPGPKPEQKRSFAFYSNPGEE